ncbi:MAG: DUF5686 and carboxypeptidase regulatory-like domain-containing protein [Flavobacteriales bacterium]|nr:DUF5686 and carboxypeptidase regulatory-like domain-containing protein [Flavobacteriales bacterium]
MLKWLYGFFLLVFNFQFVYGQYSISGTVMDGSTHEALAFVNIITTDGSVGTATDIEGKFVLRSTSPITEIRLSYIGYHTRVFSIQNPADRQIIYLEKHDTELDVIEVLPGINPADTIMEKVYKNRKRNDPESSTSFSYSSYNKMIVTMALDSVYIRNPQKIAELDTNTREAISFFEQQHLFIAESTTDRFYYSANHQFEEVHASRISGFKNPVFTLLATELQSFTFYHEFISLGGIQYEGPIAANASRRYFFLIEDTIFSETDTSWVISFRPKKGKKFSGMKGRMTISSNGFAIANVIAEPIVQGNETISLKIQQRYDFLLKQQWFPVELNTIMYFPAIQLEKMEAIGIANTYITNVVLNPEKKKSNIGFVDLSHDPDVASKDENYWMERRRDSLSEKELRTYEVIDSIGEKAHLERRTNTLMYLLEGQWPIGKISLDLDKIIQFNDYEGFRAGLGVHTNSRLSRYFSIGAYGAYGFKDKSAKYGADLKLMLPERDIELKLSWQQDLAETGGVEYFGKKNSLTNEDLSDLFRNRMDSVQKTELIFGARIFKFFKSYTFANIQSRKSYSEYGIRSIYDQYSIYREAYNLAEAGIAVRFQFGEKFISSNGRLISKGSNFPVVWLKASFGSDQLAGGEIAYQKFDFRIEKRHRIARFGSISYRIDAGKIIGTSLPFSLMYNPRGTWREIRELNVFSGFGFEVMRTNEFLCSEYLAIHFRYDFPSLKIGKKFQPIPGIVSNAFMGLNHVPSIYLPQGVKSSENPYLESGILLNNLIRSGVSGIGIGAFYRYGAQSLPNGIDNWAFKLSFSFSLQ